MCDGEEQNLRARPRVGCQITTHLEGDLKGHVEFRGRLVYSVLCGGFAAIQTGQNRGKLLPFRCAVVSHPAQAMALWLSMYVDSPNTTSILTCMHIYVLSCGIIE